MVEFLKGKKEIHIESPNGTNLTLNIEGFDFVNSAIDHNIPGSEIFAAPKIDSAQGTFVASWISKYRRYNPVKNIHLTFQDGRVSEFSASEGQDTFASILSIDDSADGRKQGGARRLGEIGLGTNPHLKNLGRNYANISLSEKIGGSVHIALGFSYKRTEYEGKPVHLNNGNESSIHWDITSILNDPGSKVVVDGITFQENGQWKQVHRAFPNSLCSFLMRVGARYRLLSSRSGGKGCMGEAILVRSFFIITLLIGLSMFQYT